VVVVGCWLLLGIYGGGCSYFWLLLLVLVLLVLMIVVAVGVVGFMAVWGICVCVGI